MVRHFHLNDKKKESHLSDTSYKKLVCGKTVAEITSYLRKKENFKFQKMHRDGITFSDVLFSAIKQTMRSI